MSKELIDRLVTANRILANEDIIKGFGHVSVRAPNDDTMYISRSVSPAQVTHEDIIEMSFDGEIVNDKEMKPYKETVIHRSIYRSREDIRAVVHHHADPVMPFTITDVEIKPSFHNGVLFHDGVPTFDEFDDDFGRLIVNENEGDKMAKNLHDHRAQLIKGHGANIVDQSLRHVIISTIFFVMNAKYQLNALQLSDNPDYYTSPEKSINSMLNDVVEDELVTERKWDYLVGKLPKNGLK